MYKSFIRPFLFLFQPETVHTLVVALILFFFKVPGLKFIAKKLFTFSHSDLEREVFGLKFKNPIGLAAGFDKNAELYNCFDAFGFSFVEVGTVTPKPQSGNPKPRSFRLTQDNALINRMGFNNKGVIKAGALLGRSSKKVIIGGNIGKNSATPNEEAPNDYLECFTQLYNIVDYFVVNVSCPNIANIKELQDGDNLRAILTILTEYRSSKPFYKPILLKVSPDLSNKQLDDNIDIALELKIDGFVATNTSTTREGLKTPTIKVQSIGNGGLSGTPINNRSTEVIRHIYSRTNGQMPIIGVGGIMSASDAKEKLNAGATLIQLYTGFIYEGPSLVKRICKSIVNK